MLMGVCFQSSMAPEIHRVAQFLNRFSQKVGQFQRRAYVPPQDTCTSRKDPFRPSTALAHNHGVSMQRPGRLAFTEPAQGQTQNTPNPAARGCATAKRSRPYRAWHTLAYIYTPWLSCLEDIVPSFTHTMDGPARS